jgi:hypothetical protein
MDGEDRTGRERKERLRAKRSEAGLAQVSGWVPKERRAYAREVLTALARGANSLPPDPEQAAELDAARAEAVAARAAEVVARAALAEAERHGLALTAELDAARAEVEAAQDAGRQAEAAALAQVDTAERETTAARERQAAAQERMDVLGRELAAIRGRRGWRGLLLRLAGAKPRPGMPPAPGV